MRDFLLTMAEKLGEELDQLQRLSEVKAEQAVELELRASAQQTELGAQ